jgi:hypothetical protein
MYQTKSFLYCLLVCVILRHDDHPSLVAILPTVMMAAWTKLPSTCTQVKKVWKCEVAVAWRPRRGVLSLNHLILVGTSAGFRVRNYCLYGGAGNPSPRRWMGGALLRVRYIRTVWGAFKNNPFCCCLAWLAKKKTHWAALMLLVRELNPMWPIRLLLHEQFGKIDACVFSLCCQDHQSFDFVWL